ncbi:MAG: class I SAM-dependent methyltransferase [Erysipelotrichaceae bacterium]|nr:class I SAM-dependent methyltransferase [Erysipelotrichaceae bacterium]
MSHYFTDNRNLPQNRKEIPFRFSGISYNLITDNGVFSKTEVDFGTWVLLDTLKDEPISGRLLDVGCGYGVIGIVLGSLFKTVTMGVDVNPRALELAEENSKLNKVEANFKLSNCLDDVEGNFDVIVTNPPIRAGKKIVHQIFEQSYEHLDLKGCLYVVIRKQQGAESAIKKIREVFKNCEVIRKEKGYWILKAQKID